MHKKLTERDCLDIQPGDWFAMNFGFTREEFYVTQVAGDLVKLTHPHWCVSAGDWYKRSELFSAYYDAQPLGRGNVRLLWKIARFLGCGDITVKYSYPKDNIS